MLYSEIIAVCSEIHTKHINKLCGRGIGFLNVNPFKQWCLSVPFALYWNAAV